MADPYHSGSTSSPKRCQTMGSTYLAPYLAPSPSLQRSPASFGASPTFSTFTVPHQSVVCYGPPAHHRNAPYTLHLHLILTLIIESILTISSNPDGLLDLHLE